MRKLLLAILLALYIPTVSLANAPATYQEFAQAHEPWNRSAVITMPDGRKIPLGEHDGNPFPSRDACVEGLAADTETIFRWLQSMHVDISEVDVNVTCTPDEKGI